MNKEEKVAILLQCTVMEETRYNREDLIIWDTRDAGEHRKIKNGHCRRYMKKSSFPHSSVEVWNELRKIIPAKTLHEFKEFYKMTYEHEIL